MSIKTEDVVCGNGMPAVVAYPADASGKLPVVVLMHERYGLVQHTKDQAARCARDGYVVIAPNFFFRHPDQAVLNKGDSRYDLTDPESNELMAAALATIASNPNADMDRVAIAGYCQTGRHPLVYAAKHKIAAAVVWYGSASKREWDVSPTQPELLADLIGAIQCPVFAAFGAEDHIISVDDVRRLRNTLEDHDKSYDIHIYAGAPHGWLNDTMPGRYRKPQADAAWAAQQAFLSKVMSGAMKTDIISWAFECEKSTSYDFSKNVRLE
ncbi:MAG: dienelactone hydrolase family protein [Beijerinckiaceae bacterium]|nr:dienelactone hydrolase family protein [Beijerinckiaceae bacterium]